MKRLAGLIMTALFAAGCATSTIETRKQERAAAYATLSPEWRDLVNQGQIKIGMPVDAVYVAWGKPTQIQRSESSGGSTVTWVYQGTTYQEYRYWSHGYYPHGRYGYGYAAPHLNYDYIPSSYVAAEVVFEQGIVRNWHNLTPPQP